MIATLLRTTNHSPTTPNGITLTEDGAAIPVRSPAIACEPLTPDQISDALADTHTDGLLWLEIQDPTDDDITLLQQEFGFHALAIEDVQHAGQRPKVDDYGEFAHAVLYAAGRDAADELHLHEVDLFYTHQYIVAVHWGPLPLLADALERWRRNAEITHAGVGALLYAVFDTMVDTFFPILDAIEAEVENLEDRIFTSVRNANFRNIIVETLVARRRDLLFLRRVASPMRDAVSAIQRRATDHGHTWLAPYMQDVYDHIVRVVDTIDMQRDLLNGAMDASLSVTSNRLNEVMKTMTASSIVLMADALIAGIYGMNFHIIPELTWTYGYPYALVLMLVVSLAIAYAFRRAWWL